MPPNPILIAYSEIGTKGETTRPRFEKILLNNIKRLGAKIKISRQSRRILVYPITEKDNAFLLSKLRYVFGIKYYAPVKKTTFNSIEEIADFVAEIYCKKVVGKTFRVTVHRVGRHNFNSIDAQRVIGARLVECGGKVNLNNFEMEIAVNIKDNVAFVFDEKICGPDGLPLGSEGKVLVLFSGGIDSPVAAWHMMRRGCSPTFLFVNLGGRDNLTKVYKVYKKLVDVWGCENAPFLVADGNKIISEITKKIKPSYRQVVLKRAFYEIAEKVCREYGLDAIVTGECVGQVSSQTIKNLWAIGHNTNLLVLRPLIGMNKEDCVCKAQEIGTYDLSIEIGELCNISKGSVKLSARPYEVDREYSHIRDVVKNINVTQVTHIRATHHKNNITKTIDIDKEKINYSELDPKVEYVIVCKDGVRASIECDILRGMGYMCTSRKKHSSDNK
ncbi:MAG: tRNA uracil 4-sulfurtransferase ThiI [Candidatus Micrarchaeia archaeon]